ncbi:hypothetical protein AN641_00950 [Candidatus Epulonipiscioides gigas]|nr:hypothetical protein AN641_00950 [Epulopiscium sp. SCG-C07WGA-EpuloA2]
MEKIDEGILLNYDNAIRILKRLKKIIKRYMELPINDKLEIEIYTDSIMKKYEILEELTWRLLSKIFKQQGLLITTPQICYKQAFKVGYIEDIEIFNCILNVRTSYYQIYGEDDTNSIRDCIINDYCSALEELLDKIKENIINDIPEQ